MTQRVDSRKSLEELEHSYWGPPPTDATHLITTAHNLRRKPVGDLTVEDLRLLVGQQIGLPFLIPLTLEILQADPFAEGDFYEGDLLHNVLSIDSAFWETHNDLAQVLKQIVASARQALKSRTDDPPALRRALQNVPLACP
jgi:hypothetical protein